MSKLKLLHRSNIIRTSRVDHADWNYRPGLAYLMRKRFGLALSLMPRTRVHRLLEVGFGSGIFLPELSERSEITYGIDIHQHVKDVEHLLNTCGITATLSQQGAGQMDFNDGFFDVIISISALEFMEDMRQAARELSRVLAPGGRLIAVMPVASPFLDWMLRLTTGEDAKADYGERRSRVVPSLCEYLNVKRMKAFPAICPVYCAWEFAKR